MGAGHLGFAPLLDFGRELAQPLPDGAEIAQHRQPQLMCHLEGQRRWDRRFWRWLARAPEAVAGHRVARPRAGSAELPRAASAPLEGAGAELGHCQGPTLTMLHDLVVTMAPASEAAALGVGSK